MSDNRLMLGYVGELLDPLTEEQAEAFNNAQVDNGWQINSERTLLIHDINCVKQKHHPEGFLVVGMSAVGASNFRARARELGVPVTNINWFTELYYTGSDSTIATMTLEQFHQDDYRP